MELGGFYLLTKSLFKMLLSPLFMLIILDYDVRRQSDHASTDTILYYDILILSTATTINGCGYKMC